MKNILLIWLLFASLSQSYSQDKSESLSSTVALMMRTTYRIDVGNSFGTCFILGHPDKETKNRNYYTLITAKHVLTGDGNTETATLHMRKDSDKGPVRLLHKLTIRRNGLPLWKEHPSADVAVMTIPVAEESILRTISIPSTGLLANDEILEKYEVNPGDELMVIGFPLGAQSNSAGYPILRSGRIASYPITPSSTNTTFLLDIEVFPGNSGGPVFLFDRSRYYDGRVHQGLFRMICGLVSAEKFHPETIKSLDGAAVIKHRLAIAQIVNSNTIRESIELLYPEHPIPDPQYQNSK